MSRRVLAGAFVLLVPLAGPLLAMMVRRVRGGKVAVEPAPENPRRRPSPADAILLGEMPPVLERLLATDPAERLAALVCLSSIGDAAAVAVLRWTIEHGPSEVVLEAALTLEEIELRGQAAAQIASRVPALVTSSRESAELRVDERGDLEAPADVHADRLRDLAAYELASMRAGKRLPASRVSRTTLQAEPIT